MPPLLGCLSGEWGSSRWFLGGNALVSGVNAQTVRCTVTQPLGKNELQIRPVLQVNLENVVCSERSQTEKSTY